MSLWPAAPLDTLNAYDAATRDDVVTFQTKGGASYGSTGTWANVSALTNKAASVTPVRADEVEEAARFEGRQFYRVDLAVASGVTAEAITEGMRVKVAARSPFGVRYLQCIGPGLDVQRLGRWLRVFAVDTGETA